MVEREQCGEMRPSFRGCPLSFPPSPPTSYFAALMKQRAEFGAMLSWNDLQAAVSQVNACVQEETDREWRCGLGAGWVADWACPA